MNCHVPESSLSGIGVVIDDHVFSEKTSESDHIVDLLAQLRESHIPVVTCKELPSPEVCSHFNNVAFILLDWELWKKPAAALSVEDGTSVTIGEEVKRTHIQKNIEFLKALKKHCFAPVFIFSYLESSGIEYELRNADLLDNTNEKQSFIFVRNKADLVRGNGDTGFPVLQAVKKWIESNPSIYVLARWKKAINETQNTLFWDFFVKDPAWPSVLWDGYDKDKDDPEHGLVDILLRNMRARLQPLSLKAECVSPREMQRPDFTTTQAVIEASMIVPSDRLPSTQYGCGDIFQGAHQHFWINIRCDCDCVQHGDGNQDDVILYLLAAKPITNKQLKLFFDKTYGLLQTKPTSHILYPVNGKALRVDFEELHQVKVGGLKDFGAKSRLGRLTSPYVTQIRQRFALHLQREGLPRIPNDAVHPDVIS